MNLSDLNTRAASNNGAKIELKHPVSRVGLGLYVHVVGKDSDAFRNFVAKSANADRLAQFEAQRKNKPVDPKTFDASEAEGIALLVACTTGFSCSDELDKDGKTVVRQGGDYLPWDEAPDAKLTYSDANATKFYNAFPDFFRQVNDGIVDLGNFMKG